MRRINRCLNRQLLELGQKIMQLDDLNQKLLQFLPEDLKEHCTAGSFNKGCLIIVISDAVWMTNLRYVLPELRDKLRKEGGLYQLTAIKIQISMHSTEGLPSKKKASPLDLSESARETLSQAGENCRYSPLKDALLRLSRV